MERQNKQGERVVTVDVILHEAAKLIIEEKEVSVSLLAEKTGKSRVSIHALFGEGKKESATTAIYRQIVGNFLENVKKFAANFLFALGPSASPIDRLIVVFRAVLVAFQEDSVFGRVVAAYHFDLKGNQVLEELFKSVDNLFEEARKQGAIAEQVTHLENAKLRSIMFHIICGLLINTNLDAKSQSDNLTLQEMEMEVLRIFQIYCNKQEAAKIEATIGAMQEGDS